MITCPKCDHRWTPTLAENPAAVSRQLNCPSCGQLISQALVSEAPQSFDDPMATLPALDAGNLTIDASTGAATIDLSTVQDDSMATLDEPSDPVVADNGAGQATLDVSTIAESSMATLDADSHSSLLGAASKSDGNTTRELDPMSTAAFDLSVAADVGFATAKNPVNRTRGPTLAEDSPMTSIGAHGGSKSIKHLTVSQRTISPSTQTAIGNADYQLLHKLGEGAMGVVYAARQSSIDRIVAIKAIKKTSETQRDSREKFLYEAQITGDLDHPNIVPIHELGENDDGTLFYAMKMVSGTPWQKVIRDRSREENVETLMKVADAIAFSHSKRVIHRDLKPENIMLGSFGEVLVMDWGLAVPLDRHVPFGLGGTPAYMAPEMASHIVDKIGPASDIYLLGAILFQIVTGVPPHPGNTGTECLLAAVRNRFVDISTDDALLNIARHAMESEPSDRYASVLEFQEAIREYKRHAESIAITGRSRQLARSAKESRNYEGFSRAIFGFQDALVLWPDNAEAQHQLQQTKIDYAGCALAKSDFDLCLTTLNDIEEPWQAAADDLRSQAEQAKQARLEKERRFVLMRRMLATVVLVAVTSLSGLSLFLYSARNTILTQNSKLEKQRNDLEVANRSEQTARLAAESARVTAELAAKSEADARQLAEQSLKAEQQARAEREVALKNEQAAKAEEVKQRKLAQSSAEEAVQARNAETLAAQAARRSALLARLGEYQTGLNLALSQTSRGDATHSQQQLTSLAKLESAMEQPAPLLRNWLYRRINTLNNSDLPQADLHAPATCASTWPWLGIVAIGDEAGNITLQSTAATGLGAQIRLEQKEAGRVIDVAFAPDASQLVSLHQNAAGLATNLLWKLGAARPTAQPLPELHHVALQQCAFSPDGNYLVAGNSGGVSVIPVAVGQWKAMKRLPAKGKLLDLCWHPGSPKPQGASSPGSVAPTTRSPQAIALVEQTTDERLLLRIDLQAMQVEPIYLPKELMPLATCVGLTTDGEVLLGDSQGGVYQLQIPTPAAQPTQAGLTSQRTSTITSFTEVTAARQAAAIRGLCLDNQSNLLVASDTSTVAVLKYSPDQSQWLMQNQLLGLNGNLRAAMWIDQSQSVVATDDRGKVMHWNCAEQTQRQRLSPRSNTGQANDNNATQGSGKSAAPVIAAVVDDASQWVTTCDREAALRRWQLRRGEVAQLSDQASWSYVGHTPGAQLHDWSIDRKQGILATCCRLTSDTAREKLPLVGLSKDSPPSNFEFCVWDLATGNMRGRWQAALTSGGRIALASTAKKLIVTDAERTLCYDLQAVESNLSLTRPAVLAFGASLVVPNPQADHQVMLLRATGAGLMWDVSRPEATPPQQSRDFNLATVNRFAPLDGLWDRAGKHFVCLLENGQLARFRWDGSQLTFDRLSTVNKSLVCSQQTQAWQCVDIDLPNEDGKTDATNGMLVTIRQRNQATASKHMVRWRSDEEEPNLTAETMPTPVLPTGKQPIDLCVLSGQELLLFDDSANAFRLTKASRQFSDCVGRAPLIEATGDKTGAHWYVLGQHDQLWQFDLTDHHPGENQKSVVAPWQRRRLPFTGMKAIGLSADGRWLAIQHLLAGGIGVSVVDAGDGKLIKQFPGAESLAWHPTRELIACTLAAERATIFYDLESKTEQSIAWPESLGDGVVTQSRFFTEAWSGQGVAPRLWLVLLSKQPQRGQQLDFVLCPDPLQAAQWRDKPIQHRLESLNFPAQVLQWHTSPNENTFITGDESGSLTIWFASPSVAPAARELTTLETHRSSPITSLQFSSDGQAIFTAAENGEEQVAVSAFSIDKL